MTSLKHALIDLREGLRYKIPLCCVLQYCLEALTKNQEKAFYRYVRGIEHTPCTLHMKAYHRKSEISKALILDSGVKY